MTLTFRLTISTAFAGLAALALAAALCNSPARALTLENYQGGAGAPSSRWVDLDYADPNKKPSRDGDKRSQDVGPGSTRFQFGPAQGSFNSRYDSGSYFTPNYLMGK